MKQLSSEVLMVDNYFLKTVAQGIIRATVRWFNSIIAPLSTE